MTVQCCIEIQMWEGRVCKTTPYLNVWRKGHENKLNFMRVSWQKSMFLRFYREFFAKTWHAYGKLITHSIRNSSLKQINLHKSSEKKYAIYKNQFFYMRFFFVFFFSSKMKCCLTNNRKIKILTQENCAERTTLRDKAGYIYDQDFEALFMMTRLHTLELEILFINSIRRTTSTKMAEHQYLESNLKKDTGEEVTANSKYAIRRCRRNFKFHVLLFKWINWKLHWRNGFWQKNARSWYGRSSRIYYSNYKEDDGLDTFIRVNE